MKPVSIPALLLVLTAALPALAGTAHVTDPDLPRALPDAGPVSVSWTDPAGFSELRYSGNRWEAQRGDWVNQLAGYVQDRASRRLADGQRMDVTITDIQRAGRYEPWRGISMDRVRIMRDTYPPRMTVNVRITGADGQVLAEGERKLHDTSYLMKGSIGDSDPLRHEKRMIDDWLRRELPGTPRA